MYGDLKGRVSADWQGSAGELQDFAKKNGIDLDEYHPVGLEVDLVESQPGETHPGVVFVLATKKAVVGDSYEDVLRYYQSHNEALPVSRFEIKCTFVELLEIWKRFAFTVYLGYGDIDNYEMVQEYPLTD